MPLQKSFSEQSGSSRNRQLWQRSKSHSAVNTTRGVTAPKRPLEPVSESSKNKLRAFQFQNPTEAVDDDDGFNQDPKKQAMTSTLDTDHATEEKAAVTPISRLAWQDLIGMPEVKEQEEDISPNERISWETKRNSQSLGLSPMMPRKRGKKRARSSSPVSSPATNSKAATPVVDVKQLNQALKASHADPALELWDRFSLSGSTTVTPLGAANPALAQIMVSSSPQPSRALMGAKKAAGTPSESGLRRAISCGTNWPKRRRVDRTETVTLPTIMQDDSPSSGSKSSMVNALLESVNGEINRSKAIQTRHDALRSPSPKKNRQRPEVHCQSPRRRSPPPKLPPLSDCPSKNVATEKERACVSRSPKEDSSDYGDDDLDDDILMVLDASLGPTDEDESSTPVPPDTGPVPACTIAPPAEKPASDDDEFGDLDDDIFAAAEDLMADIESTGPSNVQSGGRSGQASVGQQRSESVGPKQAAGDDAYEDDFGVDFDFEAAEIAATQSAKQMTGTSGSLPSASHKPKAIQRYLVTKVLQSEYLDDKGRSSTEKVNNSRMLLGLDTDKG
ncbi:hypothetical protein BJ170DRAFT_616318 [Xylariales sp. AK1849]|nr:hypothetical protein BJ170DRAFT_616318 [Xylariales sp. AK1849]